MPIIGVVDDEFFNVTETHKVLINAVMFIEKAVSARV